MALPRTKRLKHVSAEGVETFADDDQWEFLRAAGAPLQEDGEAKEAEDAAIDNDDAPATPWQALEKLQSARFELHALLELVNHVESQDFVGIGFVAEPKKSVDKYLSQHAQRLQASRQRLSVTQQRLQQGLSALESTAKRWQVFHADLEQLQAQGWKLVRCPPEAPTPFVARLTFPLRKTKPHAAQHPEAGAAKPGGRQGSVGPQQPAPFAPAPQAAAAEAVRDVPIGMDPATGHASVAADGTVQEGTRVSPAGGQPAAIVSGAAAVHAALCKALSRLFWRTLIQDFQKEGQFDSKGNVGYMLTRQLCEIFAVPAEPQLAAWVPLLGQLHLVGLTGKLNSSVLNNAANKPNDGHGARGHTGLDKVCHQAQPALAPGASHAHHPTGRHHAERGAGKSLTRQQDSQ
ncbi:hypothetical protein WJX73_003380 [Symbiochloris irregularis]|uniref:Uncharacterized protein n=1 Tax=Symbiochloris irregularis TaxID=706552 RepID=A0AAW1PWD9_9CHLO